MIDGLIPVDAKPPRVRAFVGGFGNDAREPELRAAFESVGVELERIEVVMSPATGCSRGFAFVTFPAHDAPAPPSEGTALPLDIALPPQDEHAILDRMRSATVRGRFLTIQPIPITLFRKHSRYPVLT
jgi:hypothetical protein